MKNNIYKKLDTAACHWCDYAGKDCRKGHKCSAYKAFAKKFKRKGKRNKKLYKYLYDF
jgi:hypothetical protein